MRRTWLLLLALGLASCQQRDDEGLRLESIENRVQANEFQLATLTEVEPRLGALLRATEEKYMEWAKRVEATRATVAESQTRMLDIEQRLEQTEAWIREKEAQEEKLKAYATPDGEISEAWKQLNEKCALALAGEAQTSLNFLVRIDRYMSEFPVHHPVRVEQVDPLVCMTSNLARENPTIKDAYRERELTILKARDQWLGYRIDRSWESRPERGECDIACCDLALDGTWSCEWGWDGGRWECEYDVEGWRNYSRRWHRKCGYLQGTRDFYTMPYLMEQMEIRDVEAPNKLYCVVDLVWENRVYCLSHTQYPVMQIRLPETPDQPFVHPSYERFSVIAVSNWDVIYKDEWTSTWIVTGVETAEFEGQQAGMTIEVLQGPSCCPAAHPDAVLQVLRALHCIPEPKRAESLPQIAAQNGFADPLLFEIERMGLEKDPAFKDKLLEIDSVPCLP